MIAGDITPPSNRSGGELLAQKTFIVEAWRFMPGGQCDELSALIDPQWFCEDIGRTTRLIHVQASGARRAHLAGCGWHATPMFGNVQTVSASTCSLLILGCVDCTESETFFPRGP